MIEIITNYHHKPLLSGYELTDEEKGEFDYIEDIDETYDRFFRYRGNVYDVHEFMRIHETQMARENSELKAWDGYRSDSFFSGTLIRYVEGYEYIQVATYLSKG